MKKVLIGILLAALLLTIPTVVQRLQIEEANKSIETIVPYKTTSNWMIEDPELTFDEILADFKNAGVQSISLEPDTVSSLERKRLITAVSSSRMQEYLLLTQQDRLEEPFTKPGLFIHSNDSYDFEKVIEGYFEEQHTFTLNDDEYLFIPGSADTILSTPISYDREVIKAVLDTEMMVIPRIGNYTEEAQLERVKDDLLAIKQDGVDKVLFSGKEVPFSSDPVGLKKFGEQINSAGYELISIEFNPLDGLNQLAYLNDLNLVRLHSLGVTEDNITESAQKVVRAAKERNLRAFFLNLDQKKYEQALPVLQNLQAEIDLDLPASFARGDSRTFEAYSVPLWQTAMALLGVIAFLTLVAQSIFQNKKLTLLALSGVALLALLYLVLQQSIILKALALAVALAAPIWAVLLKKEPEKKGYLVKSYAKAVGISAIGIWLIVVLLSGNQYILGIDLFRGVSLIYIVPIIFVAAYAIWMNINLLSKTEVGYWRTLIESILKASVIYWHIIVVAIVSIIALYYFSRTGNEGQAPEIELQIRALLEQILYVRPRTKEFLIGFPFFVLALHIAKSYPKGYYFLLIPGVIGFLSLVNTFTHLHIPLLISLLRSGYSIVFGFIIGLVLVWLYENVWKKIVTIIRVRWQA
ncbi:DUF5693 family protein [Planococcus donghaensis]|uniref:Uncharacterized protein n=1 Tax=Planococcus donghaensis TaxID=414778 RepID=A0A1C7EFL5_9BACL|nr:DUF5693 family protein [Planococcus donghaensis]ANU22456.1 hypothetical protein BCM40_03400 [Planococcus donghaensis]